jgi:hypothetical protein
MKILLICSKQFYPEIQKIKEQLEIKGHKVFLPNCIKDPSTEQRYKDLGKKEHAKFKKKMFKQSAKTIKKMNAVLVLNFEKNNIPNYIGGATFLEMYEALKKGKKIYMYNDVGTSILSDEINGFDPIIINGNLNLIKGKRK